MLTYDLAKKLKDAGFPQRKSYRAYYVNAGKYSGSIVDAEYYFHEDAEFWQEKLVAVPTIEELIGACGERFFELRRGTKGWLACTNQFKYEGAFGTTPTEAVANLWLKLNENKSK